MSYSIDQVPSQGDVIKTVEVEWSPCTVSVGRGQHPWQFGYANITFESGKSVSMYLTRTFDNLPAYDKDGMGGFDPEKMAFEDIVEKTADDHSMKCP